MFVGYEADGGTYMQNENEKKGEVRIQYREQGNVELRILSMFLA